MSRIALRLDELRIVLTARVAPIANYAACTRLGRMLVVSGQPPLGADGKIARPPIGKLDPDSSLEIARGAARLCAINVLAQVKAAIGDFDSVVQVARLGGFFNVAARFDFLPQAMNGASDLIADLFGARGRHARTTVGVAHLPFNAMAEIEALFEVA
jgi:enamine deaminase RidA (YjgF/YER057c/UK114 family)